MTYLGGFLLLKHDMILDLDILEVIKAFDIIVTRLCVLNQ